MIDDGLIDRFGIDEIYALHNIPDIPTAHLAVSAGPVMASFDLLDITITAPGGHAAAPHLSGDVIVAASYLVTEFQALAARRIDPTQPAVVSIGAFTAGTVHNVLPTTAHLQGTVRTLSPDVRDRIDGLLAAVCDAIAASHGVEVAFTYDRRYPVTVNDEVCTSRARRAAETVSTVSGHDGLLAAEDFAFMLERVPGSYVFIGNGPVGPERGPLHSPTYDFNDDLIGVGASYLAAVARLSLAESRSVSRAPA